MTGETSYRSSKGVKLRTQRSESGDLLRVDLEIEARPGNVAITWDARNGLSHFIEGRLRNEDIGGSHPVARVAELVPIQVPAEVIRGAVESLSLEPAWESQILALLIEKSESKSGR